MKMNLGTKLIGGFVLVAVVTLMVGGVGFWAVSTLKGDLNEVKDNVLPGVLSLLTINEAQTAMSSAENSLLAAQLDEKARKDAFAGMETAKKRADEAWKIYEPLLQSTEEAAIWKEFISAWQRWWKDHEEFVRMADEMFSTKVEDPLILMEALQTFRGDHWKLLMTVMEFIDRGTQFEGGHDPTTCGLGKWMSTFTTPNPEISRRLAEIKTSHNAFHGSVTKLRELVAQGDKEGARRVFYDEMRPAAEKTILLMREIRAEAEKALAPYRKMLRMAREVNAVSSDKAEALLQKLIEVNEHAAKAAGDKAQRDSTLASTLVGSGMGIGFVGALVFGIFLSISITSPLGKAVQMLKELGRGHINVRLNMDRADEIGVIARTMDQFADSLQIDLVAPLHRLASGDFTFDVNPKDDQDAIGNSLKKTIDDLNFTVGEISAASSQFSTGANQVSDSSQALSQGATEQAASLEEITSSVTEMASQTKMNAENAAQANQLAGMARKTADTGNQQMQNMMSAMAEINEAGKNISKIIKVIDEIAFQTNLLALNAAVEAARAGKHGKGFAVVAEEVRNLAARSAKAAKETAELIEGSVQKAQRGTAIARETAESLTSIINAATKVADLVGEIAAASNEQAQGIAQINQGLGQIDQVTQQNTAIAEEGAAAAEELSGQALHLQQLMSNFRVKDELVGRRAVLALQKP